MTDCKNAWSGQLHSRSMQLFHTQTYIVLYIDLYCPVYRPKVLPCMQACKVARILIQAHTVVLYVGKTVTEYKMCVPIFNTTLSEIFPILRRIQRYFIRISMRYHLKYRYPVKYPLFLLDFNKSLIFLTTVRKMLIRISHFMTNRPVGAELFRADSRKDRHDETNSRFLQFCEHA